MIAHTHGQLLNKSTHAKSLGVSVPTIAKYLNYLERAFHINLRKRLAKSPKVYLRDSGLLHHLLRIPDYNTLLGHPVVGHSWEGYVIEQIISVLSNRFEYFFYRTQDGAECDLVITEKFQPIACVEIKFSSTPAKTKSLTVALQDVGTEKNYVIVPECSDAYSISERITVCDLAHFFDNFTG